MIYIKIMSVRMLMKKMSLFGEMSNIFPLYWDFLYYSKTDYRENVITFFPIWWDILSAIFPYILGCFLLTASFCTSIFLLYIPIYREIVIIAFSLYTGLYTFLLLSLYIGISFADSFFFRMKTFLLYIPI